MEYVWIVLTGYRNESGPQIAYTNEAVALGHMVSVGWIVTSQSHNRVFCTKTVPYVKNGRKGWLTYDAEVVRVVVDDTHVAPETE